MEQQQQQKQQQPEEQQQQPKQQHQQPNQQHPDGCCKNWKTIKPSSKVLAVRCIDCKCK